MAERTSADGFADVYPELVEGLASRVQNPVSSIKNRVSSPIIFSPLFRSAFKDRPIIVGLVDEGNILLKSSL